jgi:disulfide bond formation protein DsbB
MSLLANLQRRIGPRGLLALVVAFVAMSLLGSLFFQHVLHLEPCPLCIIQRVAIMGVGVFALIGLFARGRVGQLLATGLAVALAIAGAGVAAWHSWILKFPPESMSCGRPFEWFHEDFPLATWLPKLFAGEGDCLKMDWTFLGLAIPHMALIAFALLIAALALAARGAWLQPR